MSYTFSKGWYKAQKLIKSHNWQKILNAITKFKTHKGWNIDSDEFQSLYWYISNDVLNNFQILNNKKLSNKKLTEWLLSRFNFDDLELSEIDKRTLIIK